MRGATLVINAGSSSVKFSLFAGEELVVSGKVSNIGSVPVFEPEKHILPATTTTHEDALRFILRWIEENHPRNIAAVVHRVVHGGTLFTQPIRITTQVLDHLRSLNSLAPLHQPHNIAAIEIVMTLKPDVPQVACFDTAFHAGHDPLFSLYAVPQALADKGVRRYGFHGLSYEWIARVLQTDHPSLFNGRIIAAHLGNGASLCAMKNGASIDTTMGMTALDGLPMGTRCGSIDPGAVIFMARELRLPIEEAERILYTDSGLKGLSGISNDVRVLLESDDPKARFALDHFMLKTAQFMGMMAVALGGVDGIIFTGGIGENAAPVREGIIARLDFLRPFETLVIPTNEERMMALHAISYFQFFPPQDRH